MKKLLFTVILTSLNLSCTGSSKINHLDTFMSASKTEASFKADYEAMASDFSMVNRLPQNVTAESVKSDLKLKLDTLSSKGADYTKILQHSLSERESSELADRSLKVASILEKVRTPEVRTKSISAEEMSLANSKNKKSPKLEI